MSESSGSIEEMSVVGLGTRLKTVFALPRDPIECPTSDLMHLAKRQADLSGQKLDYPILGYSLSAIGKADLGNPSAQLFQGVATARMGDVQGSLKALPVSLTFEVRYLDNSRTRVLAFLSKWMMCEARGLLNFRLRVDSAPIDIQCKPDNSLSVPVKELSTENVSQYEFSGTITMNTYLSGPFDKAITKVTRITSASLSFTTQDAPVDPKLATMFPDASVIDESIENYPEDDVKKNLVFAVVFSEGQITSEGGK